MFAALAFTFAFTLAACASDPTAPPGALGSFLAGPDATGPTPAPAPTVQVAQGRIAVAGWIDTPTPCYTVTASASVTNDTLVARIIARKVVKDNVGCETVIQPWQYLLTTTTLPPTVDAVRVVHDDGTGTSVVVLQQAVSLH
jgi:hypothetical protein